MAEPGKYIPQVVNGEARVNVISPDGTPRSIKLADLPYAQKHGWRLESQESEVTRSDAEEYGGHPIAAFMSGVGRTASFGLTDVANRALGNREEAEGLRAHNRGASIAGEVTGAFSPLGAGGAAAHAGEAVAGAIAREGAGLGERVIARVAGGAVEGGVFGAGTGVSEIALSEDMTVESALSTLGTHVVFGAGTGGLIGGTLEAGGSALSGIRNMVRRHGEAGAEAVTGAAEDGIVPAGAADDLLDAMAKGPAKVDKGFRAAKKADAEALGEEIAAKEAAQPVGVGAGEVAEHTADLSTKTGAFREWLADADLKGYQARRRAYDVIEGKRAAKGAPPPAAEPDLAAQLQASVDATAPGPNGTVRMPRAQPADELAPELQAALAPEKSGTAVLPKQRDPDAPVPTNVGAAHLPDTRVQDALAAFEPIRDKWRAAFGATRVTQGGKRVYSSSLDDATLRTTLKQNLALNDQYRMAFRDLVAALNPVKEFGEDILGGGATDALLMGSIRRGEDIVARAAQKVDDPTLVAMRAEYERMNADLKTSPEKLARKEAKRFVEQAEASGWKVTDDQILAELHKRDPGASLPAKGSARDIYLRAQLYGEAAKRQMKARAAMAREAEQAAASKKGGFWKSAAEDAKDIAGAVAADWMFDNTFGRLLGGFFGAKIAIRFARRARQRLGPSIGRHGAVRTKLAVLGARRSTEQEIDSGVDRFIKAATGKKVERAAAATARAIAFSPDRKKEPADRIEEAQVIASEIARRVSDPMGTSQAIYDRLADLRIMDFGFYDRLEALGHVALEYLHQHAPHPDATDPLGKRSEIEQPSDDDAASFMRRVAAVDDPVGRLTDEVAEGNVMPETVETVQAVYPTIFQTFQGALMSRVAELDDLPTSARVQLSLLFDVPIDPSMDPDTIAFLQGNYGQPEAQPRPVTKKDIGSVKLPQEEHPTTAQQLTG